MMGRHRIEIEFDAHAEWAESFRETLFDLLACMQNLGDDWQIEMTPVVPDPPT